MTHRSEEWLAWRAAGIGASDVAGILGISPWQSPYSVWAEKVGLVVPDPQEMSEQQAMGLALEPAIGALFHERTGLYIGGEQTWVEHPDLPWARATLDGRVFETDPGIIVADPIGNAEKKVSGESPARWEQAIPNHYAAQVQWQMFVTGAERTWVCVLHAAFSLRFREYVIERDETDIAFIVERVTQFWNDHVVTGDPPPTDGHLATTEALRGLPVDPGSQVELDGLASELRMLTAAKAEAKLTEARIATLENAVKAAMGEATEGFIDDELVVSWRPQTRKSLDTKRLAIDLPHVAEAYETESTSRVLRLNTRRKE